MPSGDRQAQNSFTENAEKGSGNVVNQISSRLKFVLEKDAVKRQRQQCLPFTLSLLSFKMINGH